MDFLWDTWDSSAAELELEELICAWHESDPEISLIEFLGVSRVDYAAWVEKRITSLELLNRRHGKS